MSKGNGVSPAKEAHNDSSEEVGRQQQEHVVLPKETGDGIEPAGGLDDVYITDSDEDETVITEDNVNFMNNFYAEQFPTIQELQDLQNVKTNNTANLNNVSPKILRSGKGRNNNKKKALGKGKGKGMVSYSVDAKTLGFKFICPQYPDLDVNQSIEKAKGEKAFKYIFTNENYSVKAIKQMYAKGEIKTDSESLEVYPMKDYQALVSGYVKKSDDTLDQIDF
jgi:hypothetical protein